MKREEKVQSNETLLTECRTCKYWIEDITAIPTTGRRIGLCKRYPPVIIVTPPNVQPMRPVTEISDTCGEYVGKLT